MHCCGNLTECQWRSKVSEDCPSLPVSSSMQFSNPGSPALCSVEALLCRSHMDVWASFSSSSPCLLALSSTDISQLMGWWLSHACSATVDFSIIPLSQASHCMHQWAMAYLMVAVHKTIKIISIFIFKLVATTHY